LEGGDSCKKITYVYFASALGNGLAFRMASISGSERTTTLNASPRRTEDYNDLRKELQELLNKYKVGFPAAG
jgi:hypothetical protein